MQLRDPIGHCNIQAAAPYFEALYTTGNEPKLKPHRITRLKDTPAQAKTAYRSPQITYYPTYFPLETPYPV